MTQCTAIKAVYMAMGIVLVGASACQEAPSQNQRPGGSIVDVQDPPPASDSTPSETATSQSPVEEEASRRAYAAKYALWRERCPTNLEHAQLSAAELAEIFSIIEDHAYNGEVSAMLCLAHRPALDSRSIWDENAYYWLTLAALVDPDQEPLLIAERDALAALLQPANMLEAQMDAEREFEAMRNLRE